jgi:hypothetical protein
VNKQNGGVLGFRRGKIGWLVGWRINMDETTDETNVVTLYEFLRIKIGVGVIFGQGVKGAVMDLGSGACGLASTRLHFDT